VSLTVIALKALGSRFCGDPQVSTCGMIVQACNLLARDKGVSGGGDNGANMGLHATD